MNLVPRLKKFLSSFIRKVESSRPVAFVREALSISTLIFVPGILLGVSGVALLFFPSIVVPVLGLFLLTLGIVTSVLVYRALLAVSRVKEIVSQFEGKIMVQGVRLPTQEEAITEVFGLQARSTKNDIIH